jgi:hypothetical protein
MRSTELFILFSIFAAVFPNLGDMTKESKSKKIGKPTEWTLSKLIDKPVKGIIIKGKPGTIDSKYGKAVTFNGIDDAIFIEKNPIDGLDQFTVEVIFQPASGWNFEQRYLHIGDAQADRLLLELRSTKTDWYFDAFLKVGTQGLTLIDPNLLHPLDQWYHLAYVINNSKLETYVNGKKELEGTLEHGQVKGKMTSIGVRQNGVSWFKGAIYKIKISPKALDPKEFLKY